MLKLIGALLILMATTWAGIEAAKNLSRRTRQLRQLRAALQSLESEIMYGQTPLREAALKLAKQHPKPLSLLFELFAAKLTDGGTTVKNAWDESLGENWKSLSLKQGEFEILSQFGETLGQHDRYHQQQKILLTMSQLEREEQDAAERQGKYEKMFKSLGFLSGLLLIILLI
ncbi:stage III sporulation protein SpoAB [Bacillus sp. M6-12]|uniref:stage III sporulation protein SpoIIIAB n=1 Tax=Bacillus sp. M6-12 TaxID=2054166 RepID=UPI000C778F9F|nr:stage III sporulation protein SpoIIIAB [Bacillus sp. M6-12]PLS15296.1 stage III sporulation protein SpoAB [Bacillus sp. M6-12]